MDQHDHAPDGAESAEAFARRALDCSIATPVQARGEWLARSLTNAPADVANGRAFSRVRAAANDKWAWDIFNSAAQIMLRRNAPLPPHLAKWIARRLSGECSKPRSGERSLARGVIVAACVDALRLEYGLSPTRNSADGPNGGDGQSACDVVARVEGLSYKAIEAIWIKNR